MVSLNFASWNHMVAELQRLDGLRRVARAHLV